MMVTKTLHCILGLCLPLSLGLGCSKENADANEPEVVIAEPVPENAPTPVLVPTPAPIPTVPEDAPTPVPQAEASALTAAIAAVQLNQDCPDRVRASGTQSKRSPGYTQPRRDQKRARRKRSASGSGAIGTGRACRQSAMQLSFTGQAQDTTIEIKSVRLVNLEGKDLGPLTSRKPTMFASATYGEWDQIIPANKELKASYKLSVPNWSEVDKALGGRSSGIQFKLEVEILANGKTLKLTSPSFGRTRPQMIRT